MERAGHLSGLSLLPLKCALFNMIIQVSYIAEAMTAGEVRDEGAVDVIHGALEAVTEVVQDMEVVTEASEPVKNEEVVELYLPEDQDAGKSVNPESPPLTTGGLRNRARRLLHSAGSGLGEGVEGDRARWTRAVVWLESCAHSWRSAASSEYLTRVSQLAHLIKVTATSNRQ